MKQQKPPASGTVTETITEFLMKKYSDKFKISTGTTISVLIENERNQDNVVFMTYDKESVSITFMGDNSIVEQEEIEIPYGDPNMFSKMCAYLEIALADDED